MQFIGWRAIIKFIIYISHAISLPNDMSTVQIQSLYAIGVDVALLSAELNTAASVAHIRFSRQRIHINTLIWPLHPQITSKSSIERRWRVNRPLGHGSHMPHHEVFLASSLVSIF